MINSSHYDFLWLDQAQHLGIKLSHIRDVLIKNYYRNTQQVDSSRCIHGEEHCNKLEQAIHLLIPDESYNSLRAEERYLLLAAPWILNIAWCMPEYQGLTDRDLHQKTIDWLQDKNNTATVNISYEESRIYQTIIEFHNFSRNICDCPETMGLEGTRIRVQLLTSYLRLADAIHIDDCDGPQSLFVFLDRSNTPEFFHWLKSKLRPYIRSIVPEPTKNIIEIDIFDCINSYNIQQVIKKTMEFHVKSVKSTFVKNVLLPNSDYAKTIPCYFSIVIKKSIATPLQQQEESELYNLMHEYDMSSSPNAGLLQTLYLTTMERVSSNKKADDSFLIQEISQLQKTAKSVFSIRKCHIALGKYIFELDKLLSDNTFNNEGKLKEIARWAKTSKNVYHAKIDQLKEHAIAEFKKNAFNCFLLFGYSSTITKVFQTFRPEYGINIFVCEAHNKSRFDASGIQIYNDGLNYAEKLKDVNENANITLIPDITISSIFAEFNEKKYRWIALFGANGVSNEAECGHSAGHLSLAIIAKHFKIPVYLLCDSNKIGGFPKNRSLSKSDERQDQWLRDIPNWEQDHNVTLLNYRESTIGPKLINYIITENGVFNVEQFKKKYPTNSST